MNAIVTHVASHKLAYIKLVGVGCQLILAASAVATTAKEVAQKTKDEEV